MDIFDLKIHGVKKIVLAPRRDSRGYFMRTYDAGVFEQAGLHKNWVQENQSGTLKKNTVRGLHFQKAPFAEAKLVRVLVGALLDVFVDCRPNSPTFGMHDKIVLNGDEPVWLFLPKGIAHGFCSLSDGAVLSYKVDKPYSAENDSGIFWNDPELKIDWPTTVPAEISEKDRHLPTFSQQRDIFNKFDF